MKPVLIRAGAMVVSGLALMVCGLAVIGAAVWGLVTGKR